jgi:hypothetical protein
MLCVLLYSILSVQTVYSVQLNCTDSNYTQAAATCSAAQQHSTFTVQILYKLYSLQLNCTDSNYTQAAATCSAAQQHSTFTVQILYSLQLNCTYSNYTEAAATCSAAQHNTTHLLYKYCTNCTVCNWTVLTVITHKLLLHVQLHNRIETVQLMSSEALCCRLLDNICVYTDNHIQTFDPSNSDECKSTATISQRNATQTSVPLRRSQGVLCSQLIL